LPVHGLLGPHGSGKTYTLVREAYRRRRRWPDYPVYANFHVDLPGDGPVHLLKKWPDDLMQARQGLVLIDEINLVMPSRLWDKVPGEILYVLAQARKFKLDLWWTAQYLSRVDKAAREVTSEVWKMINVRALGFFLYRSYFGENLDRPFLGGLIYVDPRVQACYDTLEIIDLPGYAQRRGRR